MCTHSSINAIRGEIKITLCEIPPFDHYRIVRDAIAGAADLRSVVIDFKNVEAIQTWMIGLILHLEESFALVFELHGLDEPGETLVRLANLERLLHRSRFTGSGPALSKQSAHESTQLPASGANRSETRERHKAAIE